jgi:hypothetical protein
MSPTDGLYIPSSTRQKMIFIKPAGFQRWWIVMGKGTYKYTAKKPSQFLHRKLGPIFQTFQGCGGLPVGLLAPWQDTSIVLRFKKIGPFPMHAYWQLIFWVVNFSWFGKLLIFFKRVFLVQNVVFSGKTTTLFFRKRKLKN